MSESEEYLLSRHMKKTHLNSLRDEIQPKSPIGWCGFTDCIWFIFWILMIAGNSQLQFNDFISKDQNKLFLFYDNNGNQCGTDKSIDFPITYLNLIKKSGITDTQCIEQCPNNEENIKVYDGGNNDTEIMSKISSMYIGNLCVPFSELNDVMKEFQKDNLSKILDQLPKTAKFIPFFIVMSIILTLLQICVLKCCTSFFIFFVQAILNITLALIFGQGIQQFGEIKLVQESFGISPMQNILDWTINIAMIIACPIYLIIFFCYLYPYFSVSSAIIEAGCDAFGDLPSTLGIPFISLSLILGSAQIWLFIIFSLMGRNVEGSVKDSFLPDVVLDPIEKLKVGQAFFNVIFWTLFFGNFGDFMLSSMFTDWQHYQNGQSDIPGSGLTFWKALGRVIICMGTVFIGTILILISSIFSVLFFWVPNQKVAVNPTDNSAWQCFASFLNCMSQVSDKMCKQFSKYGFIHCSFTGTDQITSSQSSMCLNLNNSNLFYLIQLSEILISTGGNVFISLTCAILAWFYFWVWFDFELAHPPFTTVSVIFLCCFAVNGCLLSIWDLASDSVMYCQFFDQDRKGTPPVNQPHQLKNQIENIVQLKQKQDMHYNTMYANLNLDR